MAVTYRIPPMQKIVDGVVVEMTPEEVAAREAEVAAALAALAGD